jgi:dTDP-4-amino-4,6-dideoxygalactose transaminase
MEPVVTRLLGRRIGGYPRVLANEMGAVKKVLYSSRWNMAYGKGLAHERLEAAFSRYLGSPHAVAVNTGGMALQMALRALGIKPGDEVLLQVDTCVATAFAVLNAGATPVFADISPRTFMLNPASCAAALSQRTKALIATHMWGNPEDLNALRRLCEQRNIHLIEDACLALGTKCDQKMAGAVGKAGVFSFGCMKPIQGGEGGMLITQDEALARELRSLRHWGDRSFDYGIRDVTQLAWNGRMSELVAAVVVEQLKGFPAHLSELRECVAEFQRLVGSVDGLDVNLGSAKSMDECTFTQVVVRVTPDRLGLTSQALRQRLGDHGVATWYANFEPIPSFSFFKMDHWKDWLVKGRIDQVDANYHGRFSAAEIVARETGLGFPKQHFTSKVRLHSVLNRLQECLD